MLLLRLKFPGTLLLASGILLLASCRFNDRKTMGGISWLQGVWAQKDDPLNHKLASYSLNSYRFTCDTVYVTMQVFNQAYTPPAQCETNRTWKEYAVANYQMDKDTLRIKGFYAKENFSIKNSGCHRTGVFEESFLLKRKTPDSLYLTQLQTAMDKQLILSEKKACEN